MKTKKIRFATKEDAKAILDIYAEYITDTTVTFEVEVPTIEAFQKRMEGIMAWYPWLICEIDGEVAGYAYASKHRERAAYQWSADISVYVNKKYHRNHIASELYTEIISYLRKQGYYTIYAGITRPNPQSEAFHQAYGFHNLGEFHNVGYKHGKWLGVTWYELPISEYADIPGSIRPITDFI